MGITELRFKLRSERESIERPILSIARVTLPAGRKRAEPPKCKPKLLLSVAPINKRWHSSHLAPRRIGPAENPNSQKLPLTFMDVTSPGDHQPVILVADDEVMIRNLVTILMQREGYVVLSASDGHEALQLSRKYPGTIDLLITDVEMPRMNGTDLCGHLLEERPGIKILIMSGADMSEIVSQNANLPFLPKPFDGQTIKARVRALLAPSVQPVSTT